MLISDWSSDVCSSDLRILVDGKPFIVHGGAGQSRMGLLKQLGATVIRTYGEESGYVLDEAQKHGLKVIAGFWLEHPRRGFDYGDLSQVSGSASGRERVCHFG